MTWVPEQLTSHGYVTLSFTPPNTASLDITQWAEGLQAGISRLKDENNLNHSPIQSLMDNKKFGVIGISMGGDGSIEAAGAQSSEIGAAVALAPAPPGYSTTKETDTMAAARNIKVPILFVTGSKDGIAPSAIVLDYYTLIPSQTTKEYVQIKGANHIGYIDEMYAEIAGLLGIDNSIGITYAKQRRITGKYFTAWFQYYLKGLQNYFTYLYGPDAQNDLTGGVLSDLKYNLP
jgi:predicted dienelactone hydrolase